MTQLVLQNCGSWLWLPFLLSNAHLHNTPRNVVDSGYPSYYNIWHARQETASVMLLSRTLFSIRKNDRWAASQRHSPPSCHRGELLSPEDPGRSSTSWRSFLGPTLFFFFNDTVNRISLLSFYTNKPLPRPNTSPWRLVSYSVLGVGWFH